jgi:hypothetical protein
MLSRVRSYRLAALLVFGILAGCGGGGSSAPAPAATHGTAGTTGLTVRIDVPLTGTASNRRPAYVSPATQSLAIAVSGSGAPLATFSANVTPSSPSCQTVTVNAMPTLTCMLDVPLTIPASGSYTLATTTYDQPQTAQCSPTGAPRCAGNILSAALLTATLQVNATNVVSIALGGLANSFTVTPAANGFFNGSVAGLNIWGPHPQTVTVQALDADGNIITGSGAPVLTLTSASPNVQISSSSPGVFALQPTVSGTSPIVTPGPVALTVSATPVNSPATPFSQPVPLTIQHTALFVSNGGSVLVFFDGATTSSVTLTNTNSPRGVAVDSNGTVYVGNHTGGWAKVTECTAASAYATCTTPITTLPFIEGVAVDASGNLWLTANGSDIIEVPAGAPGPTVDISSGFTTLRGVAVDKNGNLWAANQSPSELAGFAPPLTSWSSAFTTLLAGFDAPIEVAADGAGNVLVANCGPTCAGTTSSIARVSTLGIITGTLAGANVAGAEGVAIDATSTLWIANNGNGTVVSCPPPFGTTACTSFPSPGALWIAVYPSAIDP